MRISIAPDEADPPAVVDPDAMLAGPVALKRLKTVAPNSGQIRQAGGSVQPSEPLPRLHFDSAKRPACESLVDRPGLLAPERTNHIRQR